MRGKIAVAVIVVLACALFLVPYASANVEISCSVYPEKAEFNTDFVYSITLTNTGSFISVGYLKLIVGSDLDITREWVVTDMVLEPGSSGVIEYGKLRIPAGKSCTVKMRVQFTHHKLYQGAFKEWADAEKPDPPEWDKAWYEWFFIDTRSEKVSCDGSGKPILTDLHTVPFSLFT